MRPRLAFDTKEAVAKCDSPFLSAFRHPAVRIPPVGKKMTKAFFQKLIKIKA
jgi:hypothetical protein